MNGEALNREVMSIVGSGSYPRYRFRLIFTVGTTAITAQQILSKTSVSDFVSKFTPDIDLRISLTTSDYNALFANRDNLNATLIQEQVDPTSDAVVNNGITYQQKYRAFFIDNSQGISGNSNGVASLPYTDGSDELRVCTVTLVEPIAFSMSAKSAQGIFRFSTVENALKTFIVSKNGEDVTKGLPKLSGIEMVSPDVTAQRDQIVIDNHVKMVQLPNYLQHSEGGIYNHDIGSFIQGGYWYIFPLYNTRRFTSTENRLTIFITNSLKIPTADITFSRVGKTIRIVAQAGKSQDISVAGDISKGLGVRFTKATDFFDNQAIIDNNRATYNRAAISADITTTTRADGNSFANTSSNPFTDNTAREFSRISSRSGSIMSVSWQRSEAQLLTPGMPVRVYQDIGTGVLQLEGCLLQVNEKWDLERPGMINKLQKSAAGLLLYLEKS